MLLRPLELRRAAETGAVERSGLGELKHNRKGVSDGGGKPEARDSMVDLLAPLVVWWAWLWNLLGHQRR